MASTEIDISAAENQLSLAEIDNSVIGNCIQNIDRIQELIYESIEIRISDSKLDVIHFLKNYVFQ